MMALAASLVVIVYFSIQYWVIKSADQQTEAKSNSSRPLLYSLSLAASGSSWMYYGSTSYAAKHGIEFAGLYVGIVLVFTLGFPLLRKIVQLAKSEGIRSISDFIGARYGKSFTVAALVTVITTIGLIPYISLQMTAIHYLIDVFSGVFDPNDILDEHRLHLFIVAVEIGIGLFTVFYCARSPHFKERYEGLIHALAVDSVIKFTGFVLVGIAAVTFLFGSPTEIFTRLIVKQPDIPALQQGMSAGNFFGLILIGASSVLLLPNQFYLTIVQNRGASELGMARWFVPLFLLIIGIFVLPISAIGSMVLPAQASADFYFLSLPLAAGRHWLAIVAFAGGISAATTMIIAPSILLSVMISNDLILPVLLRRANINSPEIAKAELTLANQQLGKAQRRAEEANLGKTRFLADAGHDILQPLNAARLYSSSLMEQLGNSREKELASNVDSSLEAVESIISALLDISRLDTGALKPVISVFRLDALLQQIVRDFAPTAREKGLDLRIVASSAVIATDRNLLRRLIQNLVSNAIKYCRSGKILVGVRRRGKSIELQILDTGIGIPTGKLDHIFREFSRLPEGMKESDGLGLGLSIVERIAKILDLSIIVTSRVGKGSVFSVTMVASNVPVLPTIEATQTVKPFSVLTGLTVLCVDDNERSLAGMQELLTTWGCQVLPFKSGKTLLAYCVENPVAIPAVILADYNLDEENGLDVIQNIREHLQRHLKAALITADRSNHVRERALLEDISIINKPVRPAILRALLSHFSQAIAAE